MASRGVSSGGGEQTATTSMQRCQIWVLVLEQVALASEDGGTSQVHDDGGVVVSRMVASRGVSSCGDKHTAAQCSEESPVLAGVPDLCYERFQGAW
ncbi:hypothetical protein U1Q18_009300, partial [Sarracenia purpurea var. burkii]